MKSVYYKTLQFHIPPKVLCKAIRLINIRIMKKITFLSITFLLLAYSQMYAQPVNDLCANATTLAVGATCSNVLVSFDGSQTDSGVPDPGCALYIGDNGGDDIWYQLVMPATGTVRIETDTDDGSIIDGGMAVYNGADCNNLVLLACNDDGNGNSSENFEALLIFQPVGSTIFIRIWVYGEASSIGTFNICAYEYTPPPPATNDDCIDAIALTVATTCTPVIGTNFGATSSEIADATIPAPGCASYLGDDVWFSVVVPPSGDLEIETYEDDLSITDGGMAIYSGTCDPNGLILIGCDDDNGFITNENFERIELLGQTPGETLYVRIWTYDNEEVGTFNICAVDLNPLSIQNIETNKFIMYPNPANNVVNIKFNNALRGKLTISVYSIQGKRVFNTEAYSVNNKIEFNVSTLSNGMYFVKLKNGQKETVQKLIIN